MKKLLSFIATLFVCMSAVAQQLNYPHPVSYLQLHIEQQSVKMAYMDIQPDKPNGEAVLLLHGKTSTAITGKMSSLNL